MVTIDVPLGPAQPYESTDLTLSGEEQTLHFDLRPGSHTAVSQAVVIGHVHGPAGRRLLATFRFGYDYDADRGVVTVTGADVASPESTSVATTPEGLDETWVQRVNGAGFPDTELTDPGWISPGAHTADLRDRLDALLRRVTDQIVHALHQLSGLAVQVRTPPTSAAAEVLDRVLVRYRDGEFVGFQTAGEEVLPGEDAVGLRSMFGGEVRLSYGESFANVIGSTDDPKVGGLSWIMLWAGQFGGHPVICTSYHSHGFRCGTSLVGGHVIGGTVAKTVPKGSDSVWIFPICSAHNNDDTVSMQGLRYLTGVWLRNYLGS